MKILFLFVLITFVACVSESKRDESNFGDQDIAELSVNDVKLGDPQPGEWLYVHTENGQSFEQYLRSKPLSRSEQRNKLYIRPLGKFTSTEDSIIRFTADYLTAFFDIPTTILPVVDDTIIPDSCRRFNGNSKQLLTGPILDYLEKHLPEDAIGFTAITSADLYPGSRWNFVFGQARTKKRVAVSSLYRYQGDSGSDYRICLERMIKTCSHEVGHMLGCQHCTHAVCVMNGTNNLAEADSRPNRLCSECHQKLRWNLKFNTKDRLQELAAFFERHRLSRDKNLIERDLETIN